jgi:hypothetical protein
MVPVVVRGRTDQSEFIMTGSTNPHRLVIPVNAGIHNRRPVTMDAGLRRHDIESVATPITMNSG